MAESTINHAPAATVLLCGMRFDAPLPRRRFTAQSMHRIDQKRDVRRVGVGVDAVA